MWWLGGARLGLGIPIAALLFASFLGLLLFTVFLGESRNSERQADGQGENGNNGFHGAFPLRLGGQTQVVCSFMSTRPSTPIGPTIGPLSCFIHKTQKEESPRGPLSRSGSVLALRGLPRQIQGCGHPDCDPVRGRPRGGPVRKLDHRWSTRLYADDLSGC